MTIFCQDVIVFAPFCGFELFGKADLSKSVQSWGISFWEKG